MNVTPIRILIVDDHELMRTGLRTSFEDEADFTVVGEASSGEAALAACEAEGTPDVALVDLRLPGMNGVELTAELKKRFVAVRVIILSTFDGEEEVYQAFRAGAAAFLSKEILSEELWEAVRAVRSGTYQIPLETAQLLARRVTGEELSHREKEILVGLVKGMSNKEIASAYNISASTVKNHLTSLFRKMDVQDRTQAVTKALRRGLVIPD